ncbi:MAG TPA: DUF1993 domain-containing protein [Labilithrix sp.]|nr:DUF1993 domain-containing protein [Labilithrix sp.]
MYFDTFGQMKKQLAQMDKWLAAAVTHAETKKFDPNVLLTVRLAPDQFALVRQVQVTCDTAKVAASRLTGKEAPVQPDTEASLPELSARIKATIAYLDGLTARDFEGVAARTVTQPRWEGKIMTAHDYFLEHALPNFYFHLMTVYALLRHNGIPVGKRDYLGTLTQRMP